MSDAKRLKSNRLKLDAGIEARQLETVDNADSVEEYYEKILNAGDVEKALAEYGGNYEKVADEFLEKTRLQGADLGFLFVAVALQCIRIYVINKLTAVEKANSHGGREDKLHNLQEKLFDKLGKSGEVDGIDLYVPFEAIITMRGVPYDATAPFSEEIKKLKLFKGANHRFSTLGHDPLIGLVFGTANILTNTITTNNRFLLTTNRVIYDDSMKNPKIGPLVSTARMLEAAVDRFKEDKRSVAAAVIKQLIHIATDIYTPKGIQLPGTMLFLSNAHVEKLTDYMSTGDLVKVGASAGMAALINTLISAVHGCKLLFENNEDNRFSKDLYQTRTKKIITYSNFIASSSSIISAALTKDVRKLDIGGMIILVIRLFNDAQFITKLEYEYVNSGMREIYEKKYSDISLYY
ncbi:MAG: hypothetical protein K6F53_12290 [Lachnospiraceae bacterium]|nr:hypothetical protein [Lachnospiraceae bacterium]